MLIEPTRRPLPLILIRGFGGLGVDDEKRIAYQGFNDGTVYPGKRGENYIYEGLVLRFVKSHWRYRDATNVVGYYNQAVKEAAEDPPSLDHLDASKRASVQRKFQRLKELGFFRGDVTVIDPAMALQLLLSTENPCSTLWIFRYYDLDNRKFAEYGRALVRLIDFVRELAAMEKEDAAEGSVTVERPMVNIIAHSMGGLLVREAVQRTFPDRLATWKAMHGQGEPPSTASEAINKIVTLGTPHRGISFQVVKDWIRIGAEDEIEHFNPALQAQEFLKNGAKNTASYKWFAESFPVERLLTVVGTNYRTYNIQPSSWANRLFSWSGEFGLNYNRSDGLVKQAAAQIDGAARTFVHKCHGGNDSLVTSREAFEVATRFFFGNVRARLRLLSAKITRGQDLFGKSEFFFGVSIKPRRVDFELFHQSAEAEDCYGPFHNADLSDGNVAFPWLQESPQQTAEERDARRAIWCGYLDTRPILDDPTIADARKDMVLRLDFYVGERDTFGLGFSDNVIYRKQYYVRALLTGSPLKLYRHTDENFVRPDFVPVAEDAMRPHDGGWAFDVEGTGFKATLLLELETIPEVGQPVPFLAGEAGG